MMRDSFEVLKALALQIPDKSNNTTEEQKKALWQLYYNARELNRSQLFSLLTIDHKVFEAGNAEKKALAFQQALANVIWNDERYAAIFLRVINIENHRLADQAIQTLKTYAQTNKKHALDIFTKQINPTISAQWESDFRVTPSGSWKDGNIVDHNDPKYSQRMFEAPMRKNAASQEILTQLTENPSSRDYQIKAKTKWEKENPGILEQCRKILSDLLKNIFGLNIDEPVNTNTPASPKHTPQKLGETIPQNSPGPHALSIGSTPTLSPVPQVLPESTSATSPPLSPVPGVTEEASNPPPSSPSLFDVAAVTQNTSAEYSTEKEDSEDLSSPLSPIAAVTNQSPSQNSPVNSYHSPNTKALARNKVRPSFYAPPTSPSYNTKARKEKKLESELNAVKKTLVF